MDEYTPKPPPRPRAPDSNAPKLPCRATIRSYVRADATGELVTDDGVLVRFGATACKGFAPAAGMVVWLVAAVPHPLKTGYRASVINVTGQLENTRLEDAKQANRRKRSEKERERTLLLRHRLIDIDDDDDDDSGRYHWTKLLTQSAADRRTIAADLVKLKRTSHLFEDLFEDLVTIDAEAFHPHLPALDWRTTPESLAWTRAPFEAVAFAEAVLAPRGDSAVRAAARADADEPALELSERPAVTSSLELAPAARRPIASTS